MKMVSFLILAFLAAFSSAKASERIIGGENALIQTYPYQVSLEYGGSHICGGSIISQYHVLTSAHCEVPTNQLRVRAGTSFLGKSGSLHKVTEFIPHENFYFKPSKGIPVNDIAIVKVATPFDFDCTRQPIDLFANGKLAIPGSKAVITGFGVVDNGSMPKQLQVATLRIVSQGVCNLVYLLSGGLPKGQICALAKATDTCYGDSGGPLVIDNSLAGIVSWGKGCAEPLLPGVYTEIAYYRSWIDKHLI